MPATPAIDPWQRIVAVRAWEHGFAVRGLDATAGPGIVRPPMPGPGATWAARATNPAAGNIVWTGSTPKHTVAYNGPRARWWGHTRWGYGGDTRFCWQRWFAHNGERISHASYILGAAVKVFDLPAEITGYTGTGNGTLTLDGLGRDDDASTGDWTVTCTLGGPLAEFRVTRPDGVAVGTARLATPWQQGVRFTIAAGGIDFQAGDEWTIEVENPQQFIIATTSLPSFGEGVFGTTWSRRAVDAAGAAPWTVFATVDPLTNEIGPIPQPWFVNASADKAVTVRRIRVPGQAEYVTALTFDLDTYAHTAAPQNYQPSGTSTQNYDDVYPDSLTVVDAVSFGATAAIVAQDFLGDDLIELVDESSGTYSWNLSAQRYDYPHFTGSGSLARATDLVVRRAGAEIHRHPSYRYSSSCAVVIDTPATETEPGTDSRYASFARTITHRPLYALEIAPDGIVTVSEASGTWTHAPNGTVYWAGESLTTAATDVEQRHRGETLATGAASGTYSRDGQFGQTATNWVPVYNSIENGDFPYYDLEGASTPGETIVPIGFPNFASGPQASPALGLLRGAHAHLAGIWGPGNTERTRTSAQDSRGNYISFTELVTVFSGNAQWQETWFREPGAAGNTASSGSIGLPLTGTYDLRTGGPDGLTPALLADLTDYAGADVWDVGAW